MKYVLYKKATGEIIGYGNHVNLDDLDDFEDEFQGIVFVDEFPDPEKHVVSDLKIVDIYQELVAEKEDAQRKHQQELLRVQRNALLQQCDWTQLPDVPVINKDLWDNYRQELRDLPAKYADIASLDEVTWPKPPES